MIHARTDIQNITVSAEGHGGCGRRHARAEGDPYLTIDCAPCEEHLRTDKMWSTDPLDIPETYDEVRQRERLERNEASTQRAITANALSVLAMLTGSRDLLAGGTASALMPAVAACRKCAEPVAERAAFCGSCGTPQLREITAGVA